MRKAITAAIAISLGAGLAGTAFIADVAQAQQKQEVSKQSAKQLKAALDAVNGKKYSEALTKLKEVEAIPNKTPYDTYVMYELLATSHANLKQMNEAATAIEGSLATGLVPPADVSGKLKSLMGVYYNQKNYPKALEYGNRLIKEGGADADTYTIVGQAYYLQGDHKGAAKFLETYVADLQKRGQEPKEQTLQLLSESYSKSGNDAGAAAVLEKLVMYYPKPNYWNNLLYSLRAEQGADERMTLNIYRLMLDVGGKMMPNDYFEMAQITREQGNPGEAVKVLEKGIASNVFTDQRDKDKAGRLLTSFKQAVTKDQADLPNQEKTAASASTGEPQVRLGQTYLNYDQYDKAIAAMQSGISKGSLRYPEESQILLGIAQLRSGKKEDAVKTFSSVKGGDPKYERLANLWGLHAKA